MGGRRKCVLVLNIIEFWVASWSRRKFTHVENSQEELETQMSRWVRVRCPSLGSAHSPGPAVSKWAPGGGRFRLWACISLALVLPERGPKCGALYHRMGWDRLGSR